MRIGQHVLAVHAEAEARDRDAELRGRDVPILLPRISQHALHGARQPVAAGRARVDRGPRRTDDRELRRDEDTVQQDEAGDDEEGDHSGPLVVGSADDRR